MTPQCDGGVATCPPAPGSGVANPRPADRIDSLGSRRIGPAAGANHSRNSSSVQSIAALDECGGPAGRQPADDGVLGEAAGREGEAEAIGGARGSQRVAAMPSDREWS